jgi:hypothetical protein
MYVNGKMISTETVPEMEAGGMKKNGGRVNSSMIYLIHNKNFCKCYNTAPPSTTVKKMNMEKKEAAAAHY